MDRISLIVSYRNREFERVKLFLDSFQNQTCKNFELIIIDYGSDLDKADLIKKLTLEYFFAKYYYHDSRAKEWNKCIAYNIAVNYSSGNYLSFTDIDLIYHPKYIEYIYSLIGPQKQILTQMFLVDQSFSDYDGIFKYRNIPGKLCHISGKGIITFSREAYFKIGGYDNYYCDWGVEDNDIYIRLIALGIQEQWTDYEEYPVYHQWHPSNNRFDLFPEKWHDDISFHYIINQKNYFRKNEPIHLMNSGERDILKYIDAEISEIRIHNTGSLGKKTLYYRQIWNLLNEPDISFFKIIIPKFSYKEISFLQKFIRNLFNTILRIINSPFIIKHLQETDRHIYFLPEKDIPWFFRKLIKETDKIFDYYIKESDADITYIIQKK